MGELKEALDSKVTLDNLCSPEIIKLSQELDKLVVKAQLLYKGENNVRSI